MEWNGTLQYQHGEYGIYTDSGMEQCLPIDVLTVLAFPFDREIKLGLCVERTPPVYL